MIIALQMSAEETSNRYCFTSVVFKVVYDGTFMTFLLRCFQARLSKSPVSMYLYGKKLQIVFSLI